MRNRRLDEYLKSIAREIRQGRVDIELLLKKLAESIAEEVLQKMGLTEPSPCINNYDELVKRIEALEREVKELYNIVTSLNELLYKKSEVIDKDKNEGETREDKTTHDVHTSGVDIILDKLRHKGYLFLSKEAPYVYNIEEILRRKNIVRVELSSDVILISRDSLNEFLSLLSNIDTSDEKEAAQRLGKYSQLFWALRGEGLIIYSSTLRGWIPQADLKRLLDEHY